MKYRILLLILVLIVPLVVVGCGGSSGSATEKFKGGTGDSGTWTVLVFLNADNDLEPYGILNFNQMEKVGSTDKVKIVVQMDRSPGYDSSNGNWTGTRRYLVTKDSDTEKINSQMIQDMGEIDMGNPDTLKEFITWGEENYPADHYCLVIWNHGSGWRSMAYSPQLTKNVSYDDTSNTSIKTTDLPNALSGIPQQIDVIAFDASLMQMLEVAYELRDSGRILVGSEESPPGDGYVYDTWLKKLAASPGMGSTELGTVIAQEYVNAYVNKYSVTQSVIELSKLHDVAQAADDFATAVIPHMTEDAAALRTARTNAQSYAFDYYKDIIDYAALINQLIPDSAVSAAYSKLQTALGSAVVYENHTGDSVDRSHGLSIYVPEPGDYIERYGTLSFSKDFPNWASMIQAQKE
ncbi:MAG: clostripain-related cysteine peptidase [Armatimonadota bacterium]